MVYIGSLLIILMLLFLLLFGGSRTHTTLNLDTERKKNPNENQQTINNENLQQQKFFVWPIESKNKHEEEIITSSC